MLSNRYLLAAPLFSIAFAQTTTSNPSSPSIVSIFLPLNIQAQINASVISANADQTTYVFTANNQPLTLTEGESTLIFTSPPAATSSSGGVTVNCAMSGATASAQIPATAAVCTGTSVVPILGAVESSSTFGGDQIQYVPVTVTAGVQALVAAATETPDAAAATTATKPSLNAAAAATPGFNMGVSGVLAAVGMLGLGFL